MHQASHEAFLLEDFATVIAVLLVVARAPLCNIAVMLKKKGTTWLACKEQDALLKQNTSLLQKENMINAAMEIQKSPELESATMSK